MIGQPAAGAIHGQKAGAVAARQWVLRDLRDWKVIIEFVEAHGQTV
jgi:hypothetical protein